MKRAGLYVRVSTQEQKKHGLSVNSQISALRKYCAEHGIIEAGLYNDAGISARKKYTKRPALLQLIQDCKDGKIDVILFTKLDRYFRNIANYYEVQSQIDAVDVPWRAIWEDYETETSAGVFKVNIMLSIAQAEADRTSERIKAINEYKRERGDYVGRAPMGYKLVNNQLVKDEELKDGFDVFFKTYLQTYSVSKAQKACADKGLKFDRTHLYKLLKNPAYCGEASGGYKCDPYITKEQYKLIRERIGTSPRKPKVEGRTYLFSGILFCGCCGQRLTSHATIRTHVDGSKITFKKYDCNKNNTTKIIHPHLQITEAPLESYLLDHLEEHYLYRVKEIKMENEALGNNDIAKQKKSLEAKLKRVTVLFEEGDIELEAYRLKRDAIREQLSSIRCEPIPEPQPLPKKWREIYESFDDEHKQMFWRKILKSITITNETKSCPKIEFL